MENRVNLYAIVSLAYGWEDEPFDHTKLPAPIDPNVAIENVASMFNE